MILKTEMNIEEYLQLTYQLEKDEVITITSKEEFYDVGELKKILNEFPEDTPIYISNINERGGRLLRELIKEPDGTITLS